ncbi:MAG: hypothetical protein COU85_00730 [Candidatus Portnoybacteria bacterium CG10_big_fil_rev_8_21_14_0_10_44_7]|uniref:UDP-N-acetylmuramoyl-L-alanyl-D-glutamate--2, 6-diaminopimelate ligase n=1 Tax=Candidatus Portnoybacteria bacterium CG10_big_fil_rev_8_21_14_0_10_44_7 TaxID=1974816 RepID=A0A2M8KJ85_9BACT|nr:MAG: hypothetical protein COU85_00730 [Candidatus Portnoybacteria bacterium CG10_big_fil_rev_8_21_14_0_10_44_7]
MRKFVPKFILSIYHFCLAYVGALIYGWPTKKMIVIGVTGTKGKTTTCNLIAQILTALGHKVGLTTTVNFQIGEKEWINREKQTMLGRLKLQKLLWRMRQAGCRYAVIETSSEGILQHRHRGIDYDIAVLTNLSPEHIERHGGFENYRRAKERLFAAVARKKDGIGVYNLDDKHVEEFLKYSVKNKHGYYQKIPNIHPLTGGSTPNKYQITDIKLQSDGTEFKVNGVSFKTKLIGEMNVYNLTAALVVAAAQGYPLESLRAITEKLKPPAGRLQLVSAGQNFTVVIDYAHEPASLKAAYQAARLFKPRRLIAVLGAQGGGRDQGKRGQLGEVAGNFADYIFVTNEDPYDENPVQIIVDVAAGVRGKPVEKIVDRQKAIIAALKLAQPGDLVLISGKGGEVSMCVAGGRQIPWSDEKIVCDYLAGRRS